MSLTGADERDGADQPASSLLASPTSSQQTGVLIESKLENVERKISRQG